MARKRSRSYLTIAAALVVGGALVFAFWPQPTMVDIGTVTRGAMSVTIDEEGRTRVHDAYMVSTPVAGRLLRVDVEPGDPVERFETVVASMLPSNPVALDLRTREQARASVTAAEAALRLSRAELNRAIADRELAEAQLERTRTLRQNNTVSEAALDRALREARAAMAAYDTAEAAIEMRQAELENTRAQLSGMGDPQGSGGAAAGGSQTEIPIRAPASGRVLRVIQQSETTLPAGAPIMEIGNIDSDLEVLVELLSTDAVQVAPGDPVLIVDWGGAATLHAAVARVDPVGFTKFSALGVEEQRVNTIVRFVENPQAGQAGLGHGYRVEARIVVWHDDDALIVPAAALFRDGAGWSVFRVEDGVAARRSVEIARNNGTQAAVASGLEPGDRVILYPAADLEDGHRVAERDIE
ncbi:MAG: HlyD family efflux transporter periplasmic adaptor subunit [Alphaproteobacteria bacterium]